MSQFITKICLTITNAFGSIPAFVLVIIALTYVFVMLFIQGFNKWNTGIGLFSNSLGSDVELITGVGSMVLLNQAHQQRKKQNKKLDQIHKHLGIK